jgi:hypothetical protein
MKSMTGWGCSAVEKKMRADRGRLLARSLTRLGLACITAAVCIQVGYLAWAFHKDFSNAIKTIGQPTVWRSANYSSGKNFADFVVFLNQHIPTDGTVYLPPAQAGSRSLDATYLQVFLYPRRLAECPNTGCMELAPQAKTYAVVAGGFPGAETLERATDKLTFNDKWGVITLDEGGFGQAAALPGFRSLADVARATASPILWLLALTIIGSGFTTLLIPSDHPYVRISLGYGMGLSLFTISAGAAATAGLRLDKPLMVGITLILLGAAAIGFYRSGVKGRFRRNLPRTTLPRRARLDAWAAGLLLLGALSAVISVGMGYSVSDEILVWAPKGYGIASAGSLARVTEWGTNTLAYPLHVPMLIAANNLLFGDMLPAAKLAFSGYYLALLLLVYAELQQAGISRPISGCCTLLAAATPILFRHGTIAYANLPFAFYLVAASIQLIRALEKAEGAETAWRLTLSGLLFAGAAWTRPEGAVMAWLGAAMLLALAYLSLRKLPSPQRLAYLAIPLVLYEVYWWLVKRVAYPVPFDKSQMGSHALTSILSGNLHLNEAAYLLGFGLNRLFQIKNWGVMGAAIILVTITAAVLGIKRRKAPGLTLLAGALFTGMILALYYITSYDTTHDISWWVSTGLERMAFPGLLLLWMGGITQIRGFGMEEGKAG